MTYRIKLHNDWTEPYKYDGKAVKSRRVENTEYVVDDADAAKAIIRDFFDAPDKEMTVEDVQAMFCEPARTDPVPEKRLVEIRDYYNWRLSAMKDMFGDIDSGRVGLFRRDIPYAYNHFTTFEEDEQDESQNEAYISVDTREG